MMKIHQNIIRLSKKQRIMYKDEIELKKDRCMRPSIIAASREVLIEYKQSAIKKQTVMGFGIIY
jgi:hypothetical protein